MIDLKNTLLLLVSTKTPKWPWWKTIFFSAIAVFLTSILAELFLAGKPEHEIAENGAFENFQRFVLLASGIICVISLFTKTVFKTAYASVFLGALSFALFVRETPFCDDRWGLSINCIGQSANISIIASFVVSAALFSLWAILKAPEIIAPIMNLRWSWPTFLAVLIGLFSQVSENMHYVIAEEVLETGCYVIILTITVLLQIRQTWTGFDAYILNQKV